MASFIKWISPPPPLPPSFGIKKWNNELVCYHAFESPGNIDWSKGTLGLKTSPELASDYGNSPFEKQWQGGGGARGLAWWL